MSVMAPLHSERWYRVAGLKPRLLARAGLHRHRYRGQRWYLLQDPNTGRVHRFTPAARLLLAAMDGRHSVEALWQRVRWRLGEAAPTQDEVIQLLGQLHAADLLASDVAPDALELLERGQQTQRTQRRRQWSNPMAMRIPLWDPGPFLDRHAHWWPRLWGRGGALLWLAVVLPALLLLPPAWPALSFNLADRALAPDNLWLVALVFPLLKALHELGHATATRAGGGEVHDMGLMLLVLMPVPYVDASAATVLRSRWARVRVGAAGMLVELFIAALAFHLWRTFEPGLLRALCFNVMLVAGVSTLVFNGNPLLRYDAYYMLADIAELPNLAQRSSAHWGYLAERWLLRNKAARAPAATAGERRWFVVYGAVSALYRVAVAFAIALFVGTRYFFFGVVLALWALTATAVLPLLRALLRAGRSPALRERRSRLLGGAAAALSLVTAAALWLPLPQRTQAEGVLWLPDTATLRAGAPGFVQRLLVAPGQGVRPGDALLQLAEPGIEAQRRLAEARVAELEARHAAEFVSDHAQAQITAEQLVHEREALERASARSAALTVTARGAGRFTVARADDLPGRFVRQGELLGHVLDGSTPIVRVVVEQSVIGDVAGTPPAVVLRLADDVGTVVPGRVVRIVPAGTDEAPSRALLVSGGGRLSADPRDPQGRKVLARIFEVDVQPQGAFARPAAFGQRVHVRFELPPAPLATQLWRAARRLLLSHFDV